MRRKEGSDEERKKGGKRPRAQGGGEMTDDYSDRSSGRRETQTVGVEKKEKKKNGIRYNDAEIPECNIELYT
jgi:hypothetical protein